MIVDKLTTRKKLRLLIRERFKQMMRLSKYNKEKPVLTDKQLVARIELFDRLLQESSTYWHTSKESRLKYEENIKNKRKECCSILQNQEKTEI